MINIKDIEHQNIKCIIDKNPKKLIVEEMIQFFKEHKSEQLWKCKYLSTNNFFQKFKSFIENSEDIINEIRKIILSQIDNNEKIINSLIQNRGS